MSSKASSKKPKSSSSTKALTTSDYERLADFRYALRQFLAFSQQSAKHAGLTPQQHQALLAIKGSQARGGMSVGDLSDRLILRHHSAVELTDRLVRARLVTREEATQDGRKVMLSLTADAEALLLSLSASHMEELRRVGPGLSELILQFSQGSQPQ
ncbi:MAG: winged helix-turn-helix transcriptional regulator [Burkholderiales bacterium]|nr:winged helix-turn-helix transcriptional regulator [Burkholderiales bacterium]